MIGLIERVKLTSVQAEWVRAAVIRYSDNAEQMTDLECYPAPHLIVQDLVNDILAIVQG